MTLSWSLPFVISEDRLSVALLTRVENFSVYPDCVGLYVMFCVPSSARFEGPVNDFRVMVDEGDGKSYQVRGDLWIARAVEGPGHSDSVPNWVIVNFPTLLQSSTCPGLKRIMDARSREHLWAQRLPPWGDRLLNNFELGDA